MMSDLARREVVWYVPSQVLNELNARLPSMVNYELNRQVTGYLNNHATMQTILTTLNTQFKISARQTLDRVVNEDQYHG